jgi:RNA polymerase sigma factor (sigma-70 family)
VQPLDESLVRRLYDRAKADRWSLSIAAFRKALEASVERAFAAGSPERRDVERYVKSLHLEDLALASACAEGHDAAWDYLVAEYRPLLYRSADALDATGGARELADSLYADLYGIHVKDGSRRSLFRYFHGRSSLATWLRSVLAQRYIDSRRSQRRLDSLPDDDAPPLATAPREFDPDERRYRTLLEQALGRAIGGLSPRDRLRVDWYYAQQLTLAEAGRLLDEHEATVSRHLSRTRHEIRREIERWLRTEAALTPDEVSRCFEVALEDPGSLDLQPLLASSGDPKVPGSDGCE